MSDTKPLKINFKLTKKEIAILRNIATNPEYYWDNDIVVLDDTRKKLIAESYILKEVNLTFSRYIINPLISKFFKMT